MPIVQIPRRRELSRSQSRALANGIDDRTRHTYTTTMLDGGVSLGDVQIAARHADPRTTMRYDRGS